jgi:hypothetical protein
MPSFNVNVRAIVVATATDKTASAAIPGWEIYDFDVLNRDGDENPLTCRIRCDQTVTVEADTENDAVELAKSNATMITVEGHDIEDISLWVDEGIDVSASDNSAPTP